MKTYLEIKHEQKINRIKERFEDIEGFVFHFDKLEIGFSEVEITCPCCGKNSKKQYKKLKSSSGKAIKCSVCNFQSKYKVQRGYEKKCGHCFNLISNKNKILNTYCSHECGMKAKRHRLITNWLNGVVEGLSLPDAVREYLLEEADYKCTECSFSGVNEKSGKTILEIDHIDGNGFNHAKDNLKVLCPNCHNQTHTHGMLNFKNGRKARLVGTDDFKYLETAKFKPKLPSDKELVKFYSNYYFNKHLPVSIKYHIKQINNFECSRCEYSGINEHSGLSILHIDHKDGNGFNNIPSNLRTLCPNCHAMSPNFRNHNLGQGRKARKKRAEFI